MEQHDFVEIIAGKHKGLKTSIRKILNDKIYFLVKAEKNSFRKSWTLQKNAIVIREEIKTEKNFFKEWYYSEIVKFIKFHPNCGIWCTYGQKSLVSDANDGYSIIAILNTGTLNKLKENYIISKNIYAGYKDRQIYIPYNQWKNKFLNI